MAAVRSYDFQDFAC